MGYYIPFLNSADDLTLAQELHPESVAYRVSMKSKDKIGWSSSLNPRLWVDTEIDALHNWPESENVEFTNYFKAFGDASQVAQSDFWLRPNKTVVSNFVNAILDNVKNSVPNVGWVSVPQLPYHGTERNKINRALAEATQQWRTKRGFRGKLILPAIFTHQNQLNNKTERNGKVSLLVSCYEASDADGVWVVDSSLHDQDGTGTFSKRFKGIVSLHEELNEKLPSKTLSVAGPYWALGLVLWARGLVQCTAMGVGRGYQYYVPGRRLPPSNARIALTPLRRQAIWSSGLKTWLGHACDAIPSSDASHAQFAEILNQFNILSDKRQARAQVARFYAAWLKKFEGVPQAGRALALYQDFSSAYVLGKTLQDVPDDVRSPSRVAEQFMMTCL